MVWFFFKKKEDESDKKIKQLNTTLNNSFSNIKQDMSHFSKWVDHFKDKHIKHEKDIDYLNKHIDHIHKRLEMIESLMDNQQLQEEVVEQIKEENVTESNPLIDELTDIQKSMCFTLAALQKENPDKWISLKEFAQERYPKKSYASVRSTLSEYTSNLEEMGILNKRKKGKQVYIKSTNKNPYLKQKITKKIKVVNR